MRRRRAALAALVAAGVVFVTGYAVDVNPGGYVAVERLARPLPWGIVFWAFVGTAVVFYRPRRTLEWLAVAALAVAAAGSLLFVAVFDNPAPATTEWVASADGRYEARSVRLVRGVDVTWELRVRARRGLLSRERTLRTGAHVRPVRFRGPHAVEVVDEAGQVYALEFDPGSLEPR